MKELIKITEENGRKLVSARELYVGLGYNISKGNFTHWIEKQLNDVEAIENTDFTRFVFKNEGNNANITDYIITTNIAKEICMVVGVSPRTNADTKRLSKEFRRYFIECERQLQQVKLDSYMISNPIERAKRWIEEEEVRQQLAQTIEEQKPKVAYFDELVDKNLLTNFRDTAKELKLKQNEFIDWLIDNKYIYRDKKNKIRPMANYTPSLFEIKEWSKGGQVGIQTLITPRGRETFRLLLKVKSI